ncbi:hypothetical protein EV673_1425 [Limnobacter thiooxidans]|uniref:Uncharacterized protein n=2 Tax=Burkholderiaceae TaxID=119060 RepID=A0AA86MAE4_9BURK|nr:hypothetical protein EV673_1425 [Limnobacter thiooxidans]BET24703.1 hypothetical protein RGQ30_02040 [Limnobacter thiooxidans]
MTMNTATASIEQQAKIREISGNVQLVRDGFFLPAQVGVTLLPGDRLVTDQSAKAVIQFTGVNDALIVEKGAAATFNLEVVEMEQAPQWIATNIQGEGVYFDSLALVDDPTTADAEANSGLFGLFGTPGTTESTGYPVLESIVFLGATAAIYSDNENNTTAMTSTTESGNNAGNGTGGSTTTPPPATTPDTETEAGPLDAVLAPLTGLIDGLTGNLGASSPLGSQTAPLESNNLLNVLNLANLA